MPNNKRSASHSTASMIFPPIDFNDHPELTLGFPGFRNLGLESNLINFDVRCEGADQQQSFAVPPIQELDGKPQDPIIDALERKTRAVRAKVYPSDRRITEKSSSMEETKGATKIEVEAESDHIWTLPQVVASPKKHIHTWDDFHPTTTQSSALTSPFLSEQPSDIFDAVRYHLNFKLKDPTIYFRYILPDELWENLRLNILGNSSSLFIWDDVLGHFVPNTLENGKKISVTLEGVGDDVFSSVMAVFLNIGANLRRIDEFITRLRRDSESSPIRASFLHSLASVLSYLQSTLSQPPPYEMRQLVAISSWYKIYDQILKALVVLCRCDGKPPFSFFISTPHALLDHIFTELHQMLIINAPRQVTATLAYILTLTSKEYLQQLAYSIGLLNISHHPTQDDSMNPLTLMSESIPSLHPEPLPLPPFFPKSLVTSLPAARKSLSILKNADLPCQAMLDIPFTWVWTGEELEKRWLHDWKDQRELTLLSGNRNTPVVLSSPSSARQLSSCQDKPEANPSPSSNDDLTCQVLNQFSIFNFPPGSHSRLLSTNDDGTTTSDATTLNTPSSNSPMASLPTFTNFLATFPETLPPISPTLHHLAQIILRPLSIRTTVLSNLSLRLFLDSLHFNSHLHILRSYFFLTSSSFKRRLVNALLYNETLEAPTSVGWRLAGAGVAIGLAAGLSSDHKIWPPKGSDLSFSLRNVIVNSLEEDLYDDNGEGLRNAVVDAEQNLGFGLRDLPVEDGNARWLDPVCIEALDFLYLDYKTSQPLDVIVTPQTIAKYQRVFTFLLRLTRVETVMRISHQIIYSNCNASLAFSPASKKSHAIAQSLHFQLSTFIFSLSGYIYDSVIGGIFDKYIAQIDQIRDELRKDDDKKVTGSDSDSNTIRFNNLNIFMLGESHSRVLDRILKCCLLKKGKGKNRRRRQGGEGGGNGNEAGNVLRDLMDLVLRFGTVLMELGVKRGRDNDVQLDEPEVEVEVEKKLSMLSQEFRTRMINLIIAIRTMQETHSQHKHEPESDAVFSTRDNHGFMANGAAELNAQAQVRDLEQIHLDELLTRIDPSYYWRRQIENMAKEKNKKNGINVWDDVVT